MKHILTLILLLVTLSLSAQSYSPCYINNIAKGDAAFKQGRYSEAKTYYVNAKQCAGGNPSAAQQKINACDAKIKAQKDAAEAKKRAEQEATEAKRKAEDEAKRKAEEEAAETKKKSEKACPSTPTIADYDGNQYWTVQIGSQCWMRENLRTTHYADGTSIPVGSSTSTTTAYRYYPNNDASKVPKFGYLYNWAAVMHGASSSKSVPSGVQGICPNGWHVPSWAEWDQLTDFCKSQNEWTCSFYNKTSHFYVNNTISKALSAETDWREEDDCKCCPGENISSNNITGFSALPAGTYGGNHYFGLSCHFSTTSLSTDSNEKVVVSEFVSYFSNAGLVAIDKYLGMSVRCLKD